MLLHDNKSRTVVGLVNIEGYAWGDRSRREWKQKQRSFICIFFILQQQTIYMTLLPLCKV